MSCSTLHTTANSTSGIGMPGTTRGKRSSLISAAVDLSRRTTTAPSPGSRKAGTLLSPPSLGAGGAFGSEPGRHVHRGPAGGVDRPK
ncbi:hypothetical protein HNQ79_006702 [Streptomyces candidus]|uniref:Uncharacterized protein n=1 Tax=Streptomyces candidus TaxID=67283 RepID=A0A7X0LU89_9ACTN|nr:hypothetical protein [Streptomyces candidus]